MGKGLTLDSGALIAAEKGSWEFWRSWSVAKADGVRVTVPATVLAQVWRGEEPSRFGRYATLPLHDLVHALDGDAERLREAWLRDAKLLEELFAKDLSRMAGALCGRPPSRELLAPEARDIFRRFLVDAVPNRLGDVDPLGRVDCS